jgi:uncharacterized protein (DUF1330 family)
MSGYVVVDVEVKDPAAYEQYKTLSSETVAAFGGRFLGSHSIRPGDFLGNSEGPALSPG